MPRPAAIFGALGSVIIQPIHATPEPVASKASKHGKRADGKAQTSISMREDLMERARAEAAKDGRSLSNWLEQLLREKFPDIGQEEEGK